MFTLLVVAHAQWKAGADFGFGSKGPNLKLSLGRDVGNMNFKGFGSIDFRGGWSAGIGVGIKFKRSAGEVGRLDILTRGWVWQFFFRSCDNKFKNWFLLVTYALYFYLVLIFKLVYF